MIDQKLYDKIVARIKIDENGCWIWQGPGWYNRPHPGNRYGYVGVWNGKKSRSIGVHRAIMLAIHGQLTPQQCVCHRCDVPKCCNPNHLFIGTMKENIWDSRRKLRHYESRRDHCERGHPLFGSNLRVYPSNNSRHCNICQRARMRIKAGWPADLAYSMPAVAHGYRPINAKSFRSSKKQRPDSAGEGQ